MSKYPEMDRKWKIYTFFFIQNTTPSYFYSQIMKKELNLQNKHHGFIKRNTKKKKPFLQLEKKASLSQRKPSKLKI